METAILSSKGPIVIPKTVRDDAHITTGTLIEVRYVDGEILLRPLADCTARRQTLGAYAQGMDFADALHLGLGLSSGADAFLAFDKAFTQRAPGAGFEVPKQAV